MPFPCDICELQDICTGDMCLSHPVETGPMYYKRDIGCWVVKQPDGLLCYYDEANHKVIGKDMTIEQIIRLRHELTGIPVDELAKDTEKQIQFTPFRFEDI